MIKRINYIFSGIIITFCLIIGLTVANNFYEFVRYVLHGNINHSIFILLSLIISLIIGALISSPFYITACIVDIRDISKQILISLNNKQQISNETNETNNLTEQNISSFENKSNINSDINIGLNNNNDNNNDDDNNNKENNNIQMNNENCENIELNRDNISQKPKELKELNDEEIKDEIVKYYRQNKYRVKTIFNYINLKTDLNQKEDIINECKKEINESNFLKMSDYIDDIIEKRRVIIKKIDPYADDSDVEQIDLNNILKNLNLKIHYIFEETIKVVS